MDLVDKKTFAVENNSKSNQNNHLLIKENCLFKKLIKGIKLNYSFSVLFFDKPLSFSVFE